MDVSTESEFYNFPPFFTLQPVEQTQEKQLQLWRRLILDYFTKNTKENILTLASFDLFQNDQIQRKSHAVFPMFWFHSTQHLFFYYRQAGR
mmetsp:Transcript_17814/g.30376  ORF Transcript_17814/g.30376 Transcript_17814/m.30376 type:complete len:91 (+) Transcript_17814:389-661(+)